MPEIGGLLFYAEKDLCPPDFPLNMKSWVHLLQSLATDAVSKPSAYPRKPTILWFLNRQTKLTRAQTIKLTNLFAVFTDYQSSQPPLQAEDFPLPLYMCRNFDQIDGDNPTF